MTDRKNNIRVFRSAGEMFGSAAGSLMSIAKESVKARGRFVLCLSGGNTPKDLYTLLSQKPYAEQIPWKKCCIFWGDERYVPSDDERNNAHMARVALLDNIDLPLSSIFPVPVNLPPAEAAEKYEETLRSFFGNNAPRFDLILLGLGLDGHTASLFPGTAVLKERSRWVKEVYIKEQQMFRITMTAPVINQARYIFFLVQGEDKSAILESVLSTMKEPPRYPAQMIRPADGEITWYLDEKAASRLPVQS